ncbi:MAG: hypothetical protein HY748_09595 [Elusimicrobia bacterium]|nr:hypothetical protein [Elusimicrobiota bacterium]
MGAAAILAFAGLLCYGGPALLDLGFYHDDWYSLSFIHFAPDDLGLRMRALAQGDPSQLFRPFDVVLWPALYTLFGLDPVPWQIFLLCVNVGIGLAATLLLRKFRVSPGLALLGGLLILAYPSKDADLFWPLNVINPLSLLFYLISHLAFLGWVESGSKRGLATSAAFLLLSLTTYDQTVFLPLCWLVTPTLWEAGFSPRAKRGVLVGVAVVAVFLIYKLFFVPHFFDIPFRKALVFSPWHFLKVYLAGINANFGPKLAVSTLGSVWSALTAAPVVCILGWAVPWVCLRKPWEREGRPADALVFLGAAAFFLGYLPIAFSDYLPTPLNHQNRINLAPALGIVLAAVGCVAGKTPSGRAPWVLAAAAGLFISASAGSALAWAESYRRQCGVVELVQKNLDRWPEDKLLLVRLPERYVRGKAPVFDATWDVTGAIRLATGNTRLRAAVISPRMRFEPSRIVETGRLDLAYEEALFLDVERGTVEAADHRRLATCASQAAR